MCKWFGENVAHEIVLKVLKAAERDWHVHSVDYLCPETGLKPDIVLKNDNEALILDVTVVHENWRGSSVKERDEKRQKISTIGGCVKV